MAGQDSVSQIELLERSSGILADCAETCLQLQTALSPLLYNGRGISSAGAMQIQTLDRLSQQLEDLANLFSICSQSQDHSPAAYSTHVNSTAKLAEIRDRLLGLGQSTSSQKHDAELDLF